MEAEGSGERDPFAPIEASPRFATPLAVLGGLLGLPAILTGLALVFGPLGMAVALVGHVKGSRLGMPAAAFAAVAMIVGMTITNFLR